MELAIREGVEWREEQRDCLPCERSDTCLGRGALEAGREGRLVLAKKDEGVESRLLSTQQRSTTHARTSLGKVGRSLAGQF